MKVLCEIFVRFKNLIYYDIVINNLQLIVPSIIWRFLFLKSKDVEC